MVGLEAHFLLDATTLGEGGVSWEWGSPFLVTLVLSSCFSIATVSVSYGDDLGGLVSLWLSVILSWISAVKSGWWVWGQASEFFHLRSPNALQWV